MPGPLFPVQNFVAKPYSGSLQGVNVSLLTKGSVMTNDGQTVSQGQQSRIVNAQMDFLSTTYKGQAVILNLQSQNNVSPLNKILMIYVDNELNSQNVTVAFPDTQQYIGVPAFTTGYYPVLTGQLQCVVYNGTSGKVPITSASQVSVIFCNFAIPGFLSQETLDITVNSSTGPVVPVIGDTVLTYVMNAFFPAPLVQILPLLTAPQQYVITGVEVNASNLFLAGNQGIYNLGILLTATGAPTEFRQFNIAMRPEIENCRFFSLCDETGLNYPAQNMFLEATDLSTGNPVAIPTWSSITVTLTYAKVTL